MNCRFGKHVPETGYCGGIPYFRITNIIVDGIGREHACLEATCAKCGKKYEVARVHLPAKLRQPRNAEWLTEI